MSTTTNAAHLVHLTQTPTTQPQRANRNRSLDVTIDRRYQLLNAEERRLLRSLSLFAAGFTLGAVEAVSRIERPLDGLASLINNSLVVYTAQSERYHLLEVVRSFARTRLQQAGESNQVALRFERCPR